MVFVVIVCFLFFSIALFVINFLITYCQPQLDLFYNSLYLYKGKPNQERVTSLGVLPFLFHGTLSELMYYLSL